MVFFEYKEMYDISTLLLMNISKKCRPFCFPGILLKNDFVLRAKMLWIKKLIQSYIEGILVKGSSKNKFSELAPRFRLDSESRKLAYLRLRRGQRRP